MATAASSNVQSWDVEDVCNFLKELELTTAIDIFKENAVTGSDLLSFSDDDLSNELKLTHLQIRKIRKNLSEYETGSAAAAVPPPSSIRQAPMPHAEDATPTIVAEIASLAVSPPPPPAGVVVGVPVPRAAPTSGGGGTSSFDQAQLRQYVKINQQIEKLEAQQVEGKSGSADSVVAQLQSKLTSEQTQVASLQGELVVANEKLAKYEGDKWFPGKLVLKDKKSAHYGEEVEGLTTKLQSAEESVASTTKELNAARGAATSLRQQRDMLGSLRRQRDAVFSSLVCAWGPTDGHAVALLAASKELNTQLQQSRAVADPYSRATSDLKQALACLQKALQALEQGNAVTSMGMMGSALRPGFNPALGADMLEMAVIEKANALTQQAGLKLQSATRTLPTDIPYILPAQINSAAAGMFAGLLLGGVIGQMAMKMKIQQSMGNVQQMVQSVQQAVQWIEPKTLQYVGHATQLQSQLSSKDAERHEYERQCVRGAIRALPDSQAPVATF